MQHTQINHKMKKKTLIKLSITFIILLGLGLWINSRWSAWFHNEEETPYSPLNRPGRVLLTFGDSSALSRNISWQYDSIVVPSHVDLVDTLCKDTIRIPAQGEIFRSRSGQAAYYVAKLRSLQPDRYYTYRVCNKGNVSPWYHFRTHNASTRNDYSFLYVGDVQDSINGKANTFFKEAFEQHPETEFLVFGGDLTERPTEQRWEETYRGLETIGQCYPILTVTGNHDYLKYVIRKLERRFSLIFSYFLDSMIGENQVYTLKYNDMQLFCLDSNREFFYLWTQKRWLEEELKKSTARWKIVVLHHPLYSIKGEMNNFSQRMMFNPLVEKYGVDLVLQGHEHAYARMTNHTKNGNAVPPVYTVSHCSPKNYLIQFDERFDKFGTGSRYYQQIHIHGDTLTMNAYDATDNILYDSVDIIKSDKKGTKINDKGQSIPERLIFQSNGSKKEEAFRMRIEEYKHRKGIE